MEKRAKSSELIKSKINCFDLLNEFNIETQRCSCEDSYRCKSFTHEGMYCNKDLLFFILGLCFGFPSFFYLFLFYEAWIASFCFYFHRKCSTGLHPLMKEC